MKVTIQGLAGCFHEQAARDYFDTQHVEPIYCDTFGAQFALNAKDSELLALVAIENTIAGSLLQNHELLRGSNMRIIGEQKLRISHVAATLPGQKIEDIVEANSHPIALMQCTEWLSRHPNMRIVEKEDTAGSAKHIAENNLERRVAICSKFAAELYGMEILEEGIETNKHNFTRFLALADASVADRYIDLESVNKASLVFSLSHSHGSLSKVLTILSFYDINLTKIQSLPIIGREWEYLFYVDVVFDDLTRYRQSIEAVRPLTSEFRVLGEYVECENPPL